jgi:plastocyanin
MKSRLIPVRKEIIICLVLVLCSCTVREKITPKSHVIEIKSMQFRPAELLVQKGDTVIFVNKDLFVHDVTEGKTKAWTSTPLSTDQSYRMVVNESADYYCSIHPVMKGKLVMQ